MTAVIAKEKKKAGPVDMSQDYITVDEAASVLRVSTQMIGRAIKRGQLEAYQIVPNGKRLVSVTSIRQMMETSRIVPESAELHQ